MYRQDLWWEHWGIKVVVKLMCGSTCICAMYVCMCSCVYACVQRPDIYRCVFLSHSSPYFFFFFEKRPFIGLEFTCWLDWLSSKLYGPSWLCLPRPGLQVHATVLCFQCRCLGPNSGPPACIANALLTELSPSPSECIFHCCHHCVCTGNGAQSLADAKPGRYHRPTLSSVHFWFELHKIALKGSPRPPKVLTSKIIFLCFYLLLHFAQWFWETAQKITMLHLLNWPCRALPLVHASSQERRKSEVCQAHAENIITKPTRICKSVSPIVHLHGVSLALPNLNTKISIFFSLLKLISFMGFTAWKANRLNS